MFLRLKDGLYAGQVREFPPHIALPLIKAGRAENAFKETDGAPARAETAQAAPAKAPKNRGRNR